MFNPPDEWLMEWLTRRMLFLQDKCGIVKHMQVQFLALACVTASAVNMAFVTNKFVLFINFGWCFFIVAAEVMLDRPRKELQEIANESKLIIPSPLRVLKSYFINKCCIIVVAISLLIMTWSGRGWLNVASLIYSVSWCNYYLFLGLHTYPMTGPSIRDRFKSWLLPQKIPVPT